MPAAATYPGVYVEEISSGVRTITGVATSITAFVGRALMGPVNEAVTINSFGDFERTFGGLWTLSTMSYAVRDFYRNGGSQAIIVRLFGPGDEEQVADAEAKAKTAADAVFNAAEAANGPDPSITVEDIAEAAEDAAVDAGAAGPSASTAANAVAQSATTTAALTPGSSDAADRQAVVDAASSARVGAVAAAVAAAATAAAAGAPHDRARLSVGGATTQLHLEAANEGAWGNDLRARVDHDVKENATDLFNLSVQNTKTEQTEVHRNLSVDPTAPRYVEKVLAAESQLIRTRDVLPNVRPSKNGVVPPGGKPFDPANSNGVETTGKASDGRKLNKNDFTPADGEIDKHGIYALLQADLFNLLCLPPFEPGGDMSEGVITDAALLCEKQRAMLVVDPLAAWKTVAQVVSGVGAVGTTSKNAALYFPRLRQPNPLHENQLEDFVPCGAVAGIMARTDSTRGVWKAPAGLDATLVGVPAMSIPLTDAENGQLNPLGVNCLRAMPAAGRVVWGARTLQGNDRLASEWKYVPVRRTALFIEESLFRGTQWVVFEPNDEPLWAQIRLNLGAFMHNLFRQGAFQGKTPKEAYLVKCDKETTTQNDINAGVVNILVGFAPLKPAEFVMIKIQQMAGQIET